MSFKMSLVELWKGKIAIKRKKKRMKICFLTLKKIVKRMMCKLLLLPSIKKTYKQKVVLLELMEILNFSCLASRSSKIYVAATKKKQKITDSFFPLKKLIKVWSTLLVLIKTWLKMLIFFQKEMGGKSHIPKRRTKPTKKMPRKETRKETRNKTQKLTRYFRR